jgi:hypothetical protein
MRRRPARHFNSHWPRVRAHRSWPHVSQMPVRLPIRASASAGNGAPLGQHPSRLNDPLHVRCTTVTCPPGVRLCNFPRRCSISSLTTRNARYRSTSLGYIKVGRRTRRRVAVCHGARHTSEARSRRTGAGLRERGITRGSEVPPVDTSPPEPLSDVWDARRVVTAAQAPQDLRHRRR